MDDREADLSLSAANIFAAVEANAVDVLAPLLQTELNINQQNEHGETALYLAARSGYTACVRELLKGPHLHKVNTELAESTYDWTPLFIASVNGAKEVIELLIEAGADLERLDSSGWSAKEHATLRGHLNIARLLAEVTALPELSHSETDASTTASSSPTTPPSFPERKLYPYMGQTATIKTTEPVRSFGHRYLTDKSMIMVSLGTMDSRKQGHALQLDQAALAQEPSIPPDSGLALLVSASGAEGNPTRVDIPVSRAASTDAMTFLSPDASNAKIFFDLVTKHEGSETKIGRAVAMLSNLKPGVGSQRISLQGDSTVPMVGANSLDIIGTVTFNFLVITPFHHPRMSDTAHQTFWKSVASTMLIGHRGLGKNVAGRNSLQLGENTIQSFISAANLGASYVEFDVQLTKDHVPVLYHDFLVSETGIDAPVHTLTLEQFLHVNPCRTTQSSRSSSPNPRNQNLHHLIEGADTRRQRSMSVGGRDRSQEPVDMSEKMKHTRDFKKKGFKGNSRGVHIQESFATLKDMFQKLPKSVGFNMEMKYPMLHESEAEEMDTYAVEINSFVDAVLTTVYDHLGPDGRDMIFSSFNPDICLLLSFKQPSIPVLFLTDAGTQPVGDIRASSLHEAIRFASHWDLLGIVSAAEPLVLSPRLVKVVKESGLVCVSYGTINNDPAEVQKQVKEGIDAVIVDSVLAIRKELTASARDPSTAAVLPHVNPTNILKPAGTDKAITSPGSINPVSPIAL